MGPFPLLGDGPLATDTARRGLPLLGSLLLRTQWLMKGDAGEEV